MSLTLLGRKDLYSKITKKCPRGGLDLQISRVEEKKKKDCGQKRQIVKQITQHLKENTTMTLLAEAESTSSYRRKRLVLYLKSLINRAKKKTNHIPK